MLYHATTASAVEEAVRRGILEGPGGRPVVLAERESAAWKVAHRLPEEGRVLVVDASRARQRGVRFRSGRQGLVLADGIPSRFVLNLHPRFGRQVSAGGLLVRDGPDGPEVTLVRCRRGPYATWEVAKGKLEAGERPEETAARELIEELGLDEPVEIVEPIGEARYAFRTPGGDPRLKILHLFLARTPSSSPTFRPARGEGIVEVRWFPVEVAARRVGQPSLVPVMARLVRRLTEDPRRANRAERSGR